MAVCALMSLTACGGDSATDVQGGFLGNELSAAIINMYEARQDFTEKAEDADDKYGQAVGKAIDRFNEAKEKVIGTEVETTVKEGVPLKVVAPFVIKDVYTQPSEEHVEPDGKDSEIQLPRVRLDRGRHIYL